ncbi:hypothetical protein [Methylicorpusculum sp.]|uniref:hypothetical protein n=1 Tax=Methylicorpusculum sp. TaxID=2713644 RepID=UPI002719FF0B|nr:hypothetical protein [Methylicorpusculum sp.]MDO8844612.1 hypothetical protein [Methylicorpusculum sp.]
MIVRNINLVIGYFFLFVGCIGCVAFLSVLFEINISRYSARTLLFLPLFEEATSSISTTSPIYLAITTAIGAYLVKE